MSMKHLFSIPIGFYIAYTSGSQMGDTWLTRGGIFNSWEEICSREDLWRKCCRWKNLKLCYLFIQRVKKMHEVGLDGNFFSTVCKNKLL